MHKKNEIPKPFWPFSKILVHFQIFHFSKVFFVKRDELSFHSSIKHHKTRFLKTATFGNKVAH
jgi:hypothetical protein